VLLASGTARPMIERTDEQRLLAQYLAEVRKKPLLTPAQELALGEQKNAGAKARQQLTSGSFVTREEGMALAEHMRAGDQAHTALVEGNLRYVMTIAKKYAGAGYAQGLSLLDVLQEGNVGLNRGIEKFDVRRGFRVTTHVTWWVRQAITHALAKHSGTIHIPEHMQTHVRRLAVLQGKPASATDQAFSVADIAHALEITEKKAKAVRDVSHHTFLSLQAPNGTLYTTDTLEETLPSPNRSVEKEVYAREQHRLIMQAIQPLEQRSGAVLIQQHGLDGQGGMSLAEIGRALGLSRERVRQIAERATEQLRENTILQALAAEDVRTAKAAPVVSSPAPAQPCPQSPLESKCYVKSYRSAVFSEHRPSQQATQAPAD
jgi:RNA polymerase sigma factor (sigma-70 family)